MVNQRQHGQVGPLNGLDLQEERQGADDEQHTENDASHEPTEAGFARVEVRATNNDGHGHVNHEDQASVVQGTDPPIRKIGINVLGERFEARQASVGVGVCPYRCPDEGNHDERRDGSDHCADAIGIKHPRSQHENQENRGPHPRWNSKLLVEVGSTPGQHDEAHGKQCEHNADIQDPRNRFRANGP